MRLKALIRAPKHSVDVGTWSLGKMPASAFPLSRSGKSMRLGGSWEWRIVKFQSDGGRYRLLIAINLAKEQYHATLGCEYAKDMKVLATYEFHGTHPGWHVHSACGDISNVPIGRYTGEWKTRIPRGRGLHRRQDFNVTRENALSIACAFFGLHESDKAQGDLFDESR
jgi:hypothetical protein